MTPKEIISSVAFKHGLSVAQLKRGYPNSKRFAKPRGEAMATIRAELGWSYPRIGRLFGGFHHTSVIASCESYTASGNYYDRGTFEFARPRPTARGNRMELDELRVRVAQLERIVAGAGLLDAGIQRKPARSEAA